jgi:hypothetical protein
MQLTPHLDKYPNADIVWAQEEPLNNGAWTYVLPRLRTAADETQHHKGKNPHYAGRDPTSSVATGSKVCPLLHGVLFTMKLMHLAHLVSAQEGGGEALRAGVLVLITLDCAYTNDCLVYLISQYINNLHRFACHSPIPIVTLLQHV